VVYELTGSDGYTQRGAIILQQPGGTVTFQVPGGSSGVVDSIKARIPGKNVDVPGRNVFH
jgi:hypothetical protein